MWQALGPVLPLAAAEAMAPVGIACAVVMLMGDGGRRKGLAYLAGWALGIAVVGTVVLALAGSIGPGGRGSPSGWVSWLKLLAAAVLVTGAGLVARRHHRALPAGEPPTPAWLRAADRAGPPKAAVLGAVNGSLNPVNAVLVGTASLTIAHEGIAADERVAALAFYLLLGSLGVALPIVLYLVRGERARTTLDGIRRFVILHQSAILIVLCLAFAAKLTGDAIAALTR
jgi:hypothetical protein